MISVTVVRSGSIAAFANSHSNDRDEHKLMFDANFRFPRMGAER